MDLKEAQKIVQNAQWQRGGDDGGEYVYAPGDPNQLSEALKVFGIAEKHITPYPNGGLAVSGNIAIGLLEVNGAVIAEEKNPLLEEKKSLFRQCVEQRRPEVSKLLSLIREECLKQNIYGSMEVSDRGRNMCDDPVLKVKDPKTADLLREAGFDVGSDLTIHRPNLEQLLGGGKFTGGADSAQRDQHMEMECGRALLAEALKNMRVEKKSARGEMVGACANRR